MAKCPYCTEDVKIVVGEHVSISTSKDSLNGVSLSCGDCGKLLSVQIDPLRLKQDLISEILSILQQ